MPSAIDAIPYEGAPRFNRSWLSAALLAGFCLLYVGLTCTLARIRLLWFDEIVELYLSRLPTIRDVWHALETGPDLNPPLHYVAVRGAYLLLGQTTLALRLPSILGVWVLVLCLYRFVSARCGRAYGWVAMLLPLAGGAFPFAYEGRPYGLVLGLSGLALLFWQAATSAEGIRAGALVGLALSIAAAVSSHFYAVLILVPFGLGEMVRIATRRRLDLPVAIALVAPLGVLAIYGPMIAHARSFASNFWARPDLSGVLLAYDLLLGEAVPALMVAGVAGAVWLALVRSRKSDSQSASLASGPPAHEVVVAAGFALLPIFAFVLAKLSTGALAERYTLPAIIGFAVLLAFGACRVAGGRVLIGAALALILFGGFLMHAARQMRWASRTTAAQFDLARLPETDAHPDEAIVVADPLLYLQMAYYAPKPTARRLVYLVVEHSTAERGLIALRNWVPLEVVEYRDYLNTHDSFLVYRLTGFVHLATGPTKLPALLLEEGRHLEIHSWNEPDLLLSCRGTFRPSPRADETAP